LKRIGFLLLLGGMIIIPIVLIILPPNFFDNGQTTCLSVLLFDKPCLGCGMTRAIQHLIHFDFTSAYNFNKISFLVLPILIIFWIKEFIKILKKKELQR
jgi:hypothetical protein